MSNFITIVGSGCKSKIQEKLGGYIFVNSAILRASDESHIDAFITQALLWSNEELGNAKNASGLNKEQSLTMRVAKRDALVNADIACLSIVTNERTAKIQCRLNKMGVKYERLRIIKKYHVGLKMLQIIVKSSVFNLEVLKLFVWSILLFLFRITIPARFRPSTGGIAILYTLASTRTIVKLDGIASSKKDAFYPDENGILINHKFNNIHALADDLILNVYADRIIFV